jgi:hypothetical protein
MVLLPMTTKDRGRKTKRRKKERNETQGRNKERKGK